MLLRNSGLAVGGRQALVFAACGCRGRQAIRVCQLRLCGLDAQGRCLPPIPPAPGALRCSTATCPLTHMTHLCPQVILSIAALLNGLYDVVTASLLGSILSNLLLVLGETPHVRAHACTHTHTSKCLCCIHHGRCASCTRTKLMA